jgi:hypothetical protein
MYNGVCVCVCVCVCVFWGLARTRGDPGYSQRTHSMCNRFCTKQPADRVFDSVCFTVPLNTNNYKQTLILPILLPRQSCSRARKQTQTHTQTQTQTHINTHTHTHEHTHLHEHTSTDTHTHTARPAHTGGPASICPSGCLPMYVCMYIYT